MSQLADLSNSIAYPDFQRQLQADIRRKAQAHSSSIIYRDAQARITVEYPGSGQLYEQDTSSKRLTLVSVRGQSVTGTTPVSKVEANQAQRVAAPVIRPETAT